MLRSVFRSAGAASPARGQQAGQGKRKADSSADSPDDSGDGDEQTFGLGDLAQMLLAQDRNGISAAIASASSAAASDIRYFTQRGIFPAASST
jgi:hypothetical protein